MPEDAAQPGQAEPQTLTTDPAGIFLNLPKPPPGEELPPLPVQAGVGLTAPDVKGRRWAVLSLTDGTADVKFRIPWQFAANFGAGIAQGLAAVQAKAESEAHGGLILANGAGGKAGQLLIPGQVQPGTPRG